jgi:hypothetical protein
MSYKEFGLTDRERSPNREAPNRHDKGRRRYRDMMDRGSSEAVEKNLPFTFSKPARRVARTVPCSCPDCGLGIIVTKTTVMVVCSGCTCLYEV